MTANPADRQDGTVLPLHGPGEASRNAPPQDLDAEQSVLGAMLLSEAAVTDVAATMDPADHYRPAHETIHRAIQQLHDEGQAVDPITLTRHLEQSGDLNRVGGPGYLHSLVNAVPSASHAEYYAEIVRDKAERRRLIETGSRIVQAASAPDADASQVRAAILAEVATLTVQDRANGPETDDAPDGPPNPLYDPQNGIRRPHRPGPTPHPDVFSGWVGETVRELDGTTEADPVAVLVNLLSAAGAVIGRRPHVMVGNDRHPCLIWALTIGPTSTGRKGSATSTARRVLAEALPAFFGPEHTPRGLNSGEGLIEYVKDDDSDDADPASADKRLWVLESEYAVTMSRGRREGSSLPGVLRQAWDGDSLGSMVRDSLKATDPHIAILGHITPEEFRAKMQDSEMAGGTYNRFLPIFCHRNLILPGSRGANPELVSNLAGSWRTVLDDAARVDTVKFSPDAWALYCDVVYPALSDDSAGGVIAQFTARAAPYVQRVAMVYALCDHTDTITETHMRAAWHLLDYARASAVHLLGHVTGNPKVNKLSDAVRAAGPDGLSADQVRRLFKNTTRAERDRLTAELLDQPGYVRTQRPTRGRPTTVIRYAG
ncbi:DnaB-like helicase N-terminal domain-containing protein [Streptomyces sp. 549]|uniref:DnaB-like helicase N-terminal domain-containing protein n=1 Tax=Streptomyces sp. 549 TaxID=3049076 RepID=UPI0024C423C0|nr:DnaB-like helicase N-terminal domain-containing protein [Streptomyces sp. 549]MDK1473287.1 DnaB-like helicase N-terminal domain-containing protein [Streptomyces sp. 549]